MGNVADVESDSGSSGFLVTEMVPGLPGAEAGLRPHDDVIVSCNNVRMDDESHANAIIRVMERGGGARLRVYSLRSGTVRDVMLRSSSHPEVGIAIKHWRFPSKVPQLPLPEPIASAGLRVIGVRAGSPASLNGVRRGDILLGVQRVVLTKNAEAMVSSAASAVMQALESNQRCVFRLYDARVDSIRCVGFWCRKRRAHLPRDILYKVVGIKVSPTLLEDTQGLKSVAQYVQLYGEAPKGMFTDLYDARDPRRPPCPICLEPLESDVRRTPCDHQFCATCIKTSLRLYDWCPICRSPLRRVALQRVVVSNTSEGLPSPAPKAPPSYHQPPHRTEAQKSKTNVADGRRTPPSPGGPNHSPNGRRRRHRPRTSYDGSPTGGSPAQLRALGSNRADGNQSGDVIRRANVAELGASAAVEDGDGVGVGERGRAGRGGDDGDWGKSTAPKSNATVRHQEPAGGRRRPPMDSRQHRRGGGHGLMDETETDAEEATEVGSMASDPRKQRRGQRRVGFVGGSVDAQRMPSRGESRRSPRSYGYVDSTDDTDTVTELVSSMDVESTSMASDVARFLRHYGCLPGEGSPNAVSGTEARLMRWLRRVRVQWERGLLPQQVVGTLCNATTLSSSRLGFAKTPLRPPPSTWEDAIAAGLSPDFVVDALSGAVSGSSQGDDDDGGGGGGGGGDEGNSDDAPAGDARSGATKPKRVSIAEPDDNAVQAGSGGGNGRRDASMAGKSDGRNGGRRKHRDPPPRPGVVAEPPTGEGVGVGTKYAHGGGVDGGKLKVDHDGHAAGGGGGDGSGVGRDVGSKSGGNGGRRSPLVGKAHAPGATAVVAPADAVREERPVGVPGPLGPRDDGNSDDDGEGEVVDDGDDEVGDDASGVDNGDDDDAADDHRHHNDGDDSNDDGTSGKPKDTAVNMDTGDHEVDSGTRWEQRLAPLPNGWAPRRAVRRILCFGACDWRGMADSPIATSKGSFVLVCDDMVCFCDGVARQRGQPDAYRLRHWCQPLDVERNDREVVVRTRHGNGIVMLLQSEASAQQWLEHLSATTRDNHADMAGAFDTAVSLTKPAKSRLVVFFSSPRRVIVTVSILFVIVVIIFVLALTL